MQASSLAPPAGIIPMHNHPRPTLPQETQRKWNALANVGVVSVSIASILLALSPLKRFQNLLQRNVSEKTWKWLTHDNTKSLAARGWQLIGLTGLLQGINRFETAANTNQPSKVLGAAIHTGQMILYLFSYNPWVQALTLLKSAFTYAGEKNDIDNSNHPDKRREWDLSRLTHPVLNGHLEKLPKELFSAGKFVAKDISSAFSLEHWRSLQYMRKYHKKDWLQPQSYQSALGTQASLISLIIQTASRTLPFPGFISKPLGWLIQGTNIFGSSIPQTPTVIRAWDNRDQVDGKLVLLGAPLIILGRAFQQTSGALQTLGGINPVGDAVKGKGLALNSQKYLALLNELRSIQIITERDPYVTATTILNMMATSPDVMDNLRQKMGQPRLEFMVQLLKKAQAENQATGTPLHDFLSPILEVQDH